ncbi:MAG: PilZ domain-containing protein [Deltaproteobacteria bacterium]|nr:PilZ domain-containing protein [Deltaproteobacteria bacterium]MBI3079050.1 PilZ domain-containing protein [Deltaproteobacteria bacterium]
MEPRRAEGRSERSFSRIDDFLQVEYRIIEPARREQALESFAGRSATPRAPEPALFHTQAVAPQAPPLSPTTDPQILQALMALDRKLDHLLALLQADSRSGLTSGGLRQVNISGSGLRFLIEGTVGRGDLFDLRITLPTLPATVIEALGEVVQAVRRGEGPRGPHEAGIRFVAIREEDRESLVRYVFQRQRQLLRTKGIARLGMASSSSEGRR